jgi:hypothetical protein
MPGGTGLGFASVRPHLEIHGARTPWTAATSSIPVDIENVPAPLRNRGVLIEAGELAST